MRVETENLLAGVETHHPPLLTDVSSTKIRNAGAREVRDARKEKRGQYGEREEEQRRRLRGSNVEEGCWRDG